MILVDMLFCWACGKCQQVKRLARREPLPPCRFCGAALGDPHEVSP